MDLLRRERLINEGVIVSSSGFSREARDASTTHGIRLLELADLCARTAKLTPPTPMAVPPISHLPDEPSSEKEQVATLRLWRVFVASPSDVLVEREILKEIVQELNEDVAYFRGIHIDLGGR